MKNFILLLLFQVTVIAVGQPLKELTDIDAMSRNIAYKIAYRYPRALKTDPPTCSYDQYFDTEKERCLDVTGGGRVLYVNSTNSCGFSVLQPHCTNSRYYYICKKDTTILAQCVQGQRFEYHLQKCIAVDSNDLITVQPNIRLPDCKELGSFPVPDDCTSFYTCETKGQQMVQSVFRCPRDMGYETEKKMCGSSSGCKNSNSDIAFCAPVIVREKRDIEESTEPVTHITELDKNEPVSTTSYDDLTEFTEYTVPVAVITERADSNNLRSSDTTACTTCSTSNEEELLPNEETNRVTDTPETEKPVETATTLMVDPTTLIDGNLQTTENSMVVTEEITEQFISEASTIASREIKSSETENNDSLKDPTLDELVLNDKPETVTSDSANVEVQSTTEPEINDRMLQSSPLKDFKINKKSGTTITEKKTVIKETELSSKKTTKNIGVEKNVTKNTSVEIKSSMKVSNSKPISSLNDSPTLAQEPEEDITDGIEQVTPELPSATTFVNKNINNIISTTGSYNENIEPVLLENVENDESTVTKASTILVANETVKVNANGKPIVQDELLMIKTSVPSADLNKKNISNMSTALMVSNFETNVENAGTTEINPESLDKQSPVTDKENATSKENDITGKESVTGVQMTRSTMRISTDVVLPIMSVIIAIIDTIERFFMNLFNGTQG